MRSKHFQHRNIQHYTERINWEMSQQKKKNRKVLVLVVKNGLEANEELVMTPALKNIKKSLSLIKSLV